MDYKAYVLKHMLTFHRYMGPAELKEALADWLKENYPRCASIGLVINNLAVVDGKQVDRALKKHKILKEFKLLYALHKSITQPNKKGLYNRDIKEGFYLFDVERSLEGFWSHTVEEAVYNVSTGETTIVKKKRKSNRKD